MKTLVMTGGGTAGHCIPNVALLPELKKHFDKIYYVGSYSGIEQKIISKEGIPYYGIPTVKLERRLTLKNFKIPFVLLNSIRRSERLLIKLNPSVVFSKGGYVSLPVVIAAKRLKIPVVLHESDLSLGLANKISARYSEYLITSFPQTAKNYDNAVFIGSPVRQNLFYGDKNFIKTFNFVSSKPILTIIGGSLGSRDLNQIVRKNIKSLTKTFNVIHLCGKGNLSFFRAEGYRQIEFCNAMPNLYAITDVALCRAGANVLAELIALNIPALIVPLPQKASRGDQIENANYFSKKNAFKTVFQEQLENLDLHAEITNLYNDRQRYKDAQKKLYNPNVNKRIADIILDTV